LAAFRDYVREVYPDLSSLNRQWGTKYADWAEVQPITYAEAKTTGNYAPWLEHRLSAGRVWARLYGRTGQTLSAGDPGARAGFDGPQLFSRSGDRSKAGWNGPIQCRSCSSLRILQ